MNEARRGAARRGGKPGYIFRANVRYRQLVP
jgi:hypothetical protein